MYACWYVCVHADVCIFVSVYGWVSVHVRKSVYACVRAFVRVSVCS